MQVKTEALSCLPFWRGPLIDFLFSCHYWRSPSRDCGIHTGCHSTDTLTEANPISQQTLCTSFSQVYQVVSWGHKAHQNEAREIQEIEIFCYAAFCVYYRIPWNLARDFLLFDGEMFLHADFPCVYTALLFMYSCRYGMQTWQESTSRVRLT